MLKFKDKIKKTAFCLTLSLLVAGCSFPGVYKINVQQGNIITQKMLDKLKPGMTPNQVHFVLGTPILKDLFNKNKETYLYTFQNAGGKIQKQNITVYYAQNKMTHFTGSLIKEHSAY
jgi:outer membrane protein assembly factor BamE